MNRALYLMGYTPEQAEELERAYAAQCQARSVPYDVGALEDLARQFKSAEFKGTMQNIGRQDRLKASNAKPHSGQKVRSTHPALRR